MLETVLGEGDVLRRVEGWHVWRLLLGMDSYCMQILIAVGIDAMMVTWLLSGNVDY